MTPEQWRKTLKPRLRQYACGLWEFSKHGLTAIGRTAEEAVRNWRQICL